MLLVNLPCTILFFIFLYLKLEKKIDWSWWWVTAPLWGGFILDCFTGFILGLLFY